MIDLLSIQRRVHARRLVARVQVDGRVGRVGVDDERIEDGAVVRIGLADEFVVPELHVEFAVGGRDDREGALADVSGAISVQGTRVTIEVPLSAQVVPFRDEKKPARLRNQSLLGPAVFGVTLGGPGLERNDIVTLSGRHSKDEVVPARRVEKIAPLPIVNAQSFVEPHPRRTPMIWSGERVVRGIETYDDDLIIEPGTVLRMAPGSSVFLRGRVVARGTASDPIRVEPLEPGQDPWGTLAIVGHGADGSELSWVEMREGSGHKVPLSEYSAMFSVHDVDGIRITD